MFLQPEAHPWTKFERAKEHILTLTADLARYLERIRDEPDFYGADADIDEETRHCVAYLRLPEPPNYLRWGALVGDAMHNLRSALDHMIEAATIRYRGASLPLTEFPIFDIEHGEGGRTGYKDTKRKQPDHPAPRSGLYRVRGIDPRLSALVERLQPYHYGDQAHRHPLWRLGEFDNIDKHRVIPLFGLAGVVDRFDVGGWEVHSLRVNPVMRYEDGAELAEFDIGEGSGEMNMQLNLTVQIRFGDGEPGFGEEVAPILEETMTIVYEILRGFQEVALIHEGLPPSRG